MKPLPWRTIKAPSSSRRLGCRTADLVLALTGKASDAVEVLISGITAMRSLGSTFLRSFHLSNLARTYAELGNYEDAWRCIGEAMTAVETNKERWCEAEVHRIPGEVSLESLEPDVGKAQAHFERALVVARAQQAKSWELRAAISMARLWRDQSKRQQAHDLLAPVYGWFTEGFDTLDLKEVRALVDELTVTVATPYTTLFLARRFRVVFY